MIIILCSAVWRVSADALAQEATPAALTMARPTLWSFEEPESSAAPHLVICMADRVDSVLRFASTRSEMKQRLVLRRC